ncbi:Obg family GTPase CgtA [Patescibacteria group bacterium]|nr:Obg family GTPase CgtA [Patescibacteria group bacterium]MBU1472691.1 Obg family GTPase CgtA [Patescibacteria group bacterium]MBU2460136.1 Obg family GTPase CgtA [Patescibacteria group bacterium]MBU2544383.1 Obg family GTPase CgtA [Patescibacteria group bacterium]
MLIDNVTLVVKAGDGGNGAATFRRDATTSRGGPDGGNGGNGGDVSFRGSANVNDLRRFRYKKTIRGENGANGTKHNGFGKNAKHIVIFVPLGTRIKNLDTGESIEIESESKPVLIVRGGAGGYGNVKFKSATNQSPKNRELGGLGESKNIHLELRIIAEIGLIGLPNAGKSSLLAVLTHATPAIGAYPFTTLEPNVGMFGKYPIADIPGLIEGASRGIGLGIKFLKHIEKTKILVHCIDITIDDPLKAYETVRKEFREYNPLLLEKPEIIFLNKTDLVDENKIKEITKLFKPLHKKVCTGSVHNEKSIHALKHLLIKLLT